MIEGTEVKKLVSKKGLDLINTRIETAQNKADSFILQPEEIKVDASNFNSWGERLKDIKKAIRTLETDQKEATKPLDNLKKEIRDTYVAIIDNLKLTVGRVESKMQSHIKEVRRKEEELRREKEAEARQRTKEEQEKLRQEAEKRKESGDEIGAIEAETKADEVQEQVEWTPETKQPQGHHTRKTWKVRVINTRRLLDHIMLNPNLINDLMEISQPKLNQFAKTHKNEVEIPGLEFYLDEKMVTRL